MEMVNVVIVGHVDHGKSTLIGRLLYDSHTVTEARVEEVQKLAEEYKRRFEFAWFLDSFEDELREERSIDTTGVMFKSDRRLYSIVDVPGHKEFIKNMLTGASRAEVAVLVVDAVAGVGEQTGRHAYLLHMLGIENLIVFVNKMDAVGYDEEVYRNVVTDVKEILRRINGGYLVVFVAGSALEGDNVYTRSQKMKWYKGGALVRMLDARARKKKASSWRRFVVQMPYDGLTLGRVESGTVREWDELLFAPESLMLANVEEIVVHGGRLKEAVAGDAVGLRLTNGVIPSRGDVGLPHDCEHVYSRFITVEAVTLNGTLRIGDTFTLRCGTRRVNAVVRCIDYRIDSETGEVKAVGPMSVGENEAMIARLEVDPIVVERFADVPELGRFTMARERNIGMGIVLEK